MAAVRRMVILRLVGALGGLSSAVAMSGTAGARPTAPAVHGPWGSAVGGPLHRTFTVTRADSGRSYRLRQGQHLDVRLSGPSGITWTEPTSSQAAVLERVHGSSGTTSTAALTAVGGGVAVVSASGADESCPQCLGPIFGFEVTVSVG